ncbi:GntR family transcriptional regulator [Paracoccaceae bacterium Fryx2]|nr:GntR family transcriptional regulator [Paracoccaceae bacterium Fryx2]
MPSHSAESARRSHRDRIYDLTIGRIQRGEIGRGDRLVDTTLAAELGVSRMPVRDALMRLAHEGYLVPTTRGFMIPTPSPAEVLEVFEIRRLLEPRAAAGAAQALDAAGLARLETAVADARRAVDDGDIGLFFRASVAFRDGWLSAVPNRSLQETIRRYLAQVQAVRLATMRDSASQAVILRGQQDLLACFRQGDALAAADRMLRFVVEGETRFLALLAPEAGA